MILVLSKEDIPLARAEAETLMGKGELHDNILNVPSNRIYPLAYTKEFHQLLFTCKNLKQLEEYDWKSIIKGSYRVTGKNQKQAAAIIWHSLRKPKVDLDNPETDIHIMGTGPFFVTELINKNTEDFNARKPHNRPSTLPISLHPKLARCMVNLTGCREDTIYDPFCGTGGLLIEAGLSGRRCSGSDIDPIMIRRCRENLNHYLVPATLKAKDIMKTKKKYRYIVADLPYFRNTRKVQHTYSEFIQAIGDILLKRAVITIPHTARIRTDLHITHEFTYYIHKTLSKRILVLDK
ncbi:MAG: DNA methyltransferase [Candidatus Woesearchaeota archaeon]